MLSLDNDLMSEAMMGVATVVGVAVGNEQLTGTAVGVSGSSFDSSSVGCVFEGVSCSWLSGG